MITQNFTKPLTKQFHRWIQKMFYQTKILLTKLLIAVKEKLMTFYATTYTGSGGNQTCILIISIKKNMFSQFEITIFFSKSTLSTLFITIPHEKVRIRLFDIIESCFFNENGNQKYLYLVRTLFVEHSSDSTHKWYMYVVGIKNTKVLHKQYLLSIGNQVFHVIWSNSHEHKLCSVINWRVFVLL